MSPQLMPSGDDPTRPRPEAPIQVTIDGSPVQALPGQTVAAALMASGRDSWRRTRSGDRPRGVFCGIGACFDCLVVVNGIPDVRACQRLVAEGDTIASQAGASLPSSGPDAALGATDRRSIDTEVVVVGAGPAGMGAALVAAEAGVDVLLVDAAPAMGGQYHRQLAFPADRPDVVQHGWASFAGLRERIRRHERITHLAETSVWAIEPVPGGHRLRLQTGPADAPGRQMTSVDTAALVLATGAYDRVLPFPGWDLPGVYAAGAAQALAKGQRIAVGERVLLAGTGPFLLPVAESLLGVGARPMALLDANQRTAIAKGWLTDPLVARGKLREAARYAAMLTRHRIPAKFGMTVVAAHGTDRVSAVTVARLDRSWRVVPGSERRIEVDAVCLGFGFTAQLELAVSARCELGSGPDGGPAVVVDDHQHTSVPGVLAAGELTGIGGADLAAAEGRVAGAAAAALLGARTEPAPADLRAVANGKRFARALAAAYPVRPGWRTWSDDGTTVCRCEEVTRGELRETVTQRDVLGPRTLRLSTRVGLGLCQGRVCARNADELAATDTSGVVRPDAAAVARRPIAVPVRLRDLAATPDPLEDR